MVDLREPERERLFGDDLRLVEQVGGLDLMPGSRGDLALAHGNDNIIQALILRLRVKRGELEAIGWPDYGSRLHELIGQKSQFIIATHSPIILAYPGATIYELTEMGPQQVAYEDLEHVQVTRNFLNRTETFLNVLLDEDEGG